MKVESLHRHAEALLDALVDIGPMTAAECCAHMGWPRGRFDRAVRHARDELAPELGLAIPTPTPPMWQYQVTTEWGPVEAGAAYSMGQVESRLRSIARDVAIVKPSLDQGSVAWRRANFLDRHLSHILNTLKEINDGEG